MYYYYYYHYLFIIITIIAQTNLKILPILGQWTKSNLVFALNRTTLISCETLRAGAVYRLR